MRWLFANWSYKLLALTIALGLWAVAHGSSSIERAYDIPVELREIPEDLVVTDQSVDAVNVRVRATPAALRTLRTDGLAYSVSLAGARPGVAALEVDSSRIEQQLPRGARIVSRSPSQIDVTLERRATRTVRVRPDVAGEPAPGYVVRGVEVSPGRVQITGARSEVLRLSEVVTDPVDIAGAEGPVERDVRISLGDRPGVWVAKPGPVRVRVDIEPEAPPADESGQAGD